MHQAWTTGTATLDGEFWQVDGAIVEPRPLQEGGIPFWVAGGGEKVTLKIAAQYASYTNFNGGAEEFARKSEILRGHCEKLGTDFDAITRSSNFNTIIAETSAEVHRKVDALEARLAESIGDAKAAEVVAQYRGVPSKEGIAGTPDEVIDVLRERQALGQEYSIHYFADSAYDRSGVELFEKTVIPALS
jgi:alkanesulfonate monooxygenase SsuD/methylene tetrahydromethanopterin reductase-like flavin-dependent oxidoreductase (luciferase family)